MNKEILKQIVKSIKNNPVNGKCTGHLYSPHYKNGPCRFCCKFNKSDRDILIEIIEKIEKYKFSI